MSIIHIRIILLCVIYTKHGYCADIFFTIKFYFSDLIAIRNLYIIQFCLMTGIRSIETLYDHCRHNFCVHRFTRNFRFVPCTVYLNRLNFCELWCFPCLCIWIPCKIVFNIVYCCQYMSIIHIRIILLCVIYTKHGYCADIFFTIKFYVSDLIAIRNV